MKEYKSNNIGKYTFTKAREEKKGTIVFFHGFATTSEYHDNVRHELTKNYDYYTIELPGHGIVVNEFSNNKKIDLNWFVDYAEKLIKSWNIGSFYLIGHSMGGGLSIRLANRMKNDVKALISVTPMNSKLNAFKSIFFNYKTFNPKNFKQCLNLQNKLYYNLSNTFTPEEIDKLITKEVKYQNDNRPFLLKTKKAMFSLKNKKQCNNNEKALSVPTLAICGRHDRVIFPNSVLKTFNNNHMKNINAEIIIFENSAHLPFHEEKEKYIKTVLNFLDLN